MFTTCSIQIILMKPLTSSPLLQTVLRHLHVGNWTLFNYDSADKLKLKWLIHVVTVLELFNFAITHVCQLRLLTV